MSLMINDNIHVSCDTAAQTFKVIIMGEWHYDTLNRCGLSLMTILDIGKVKNIFSYEDMADLINMNTKQILIPDLYGDLNWFMDESEENASLLRDVGNLSDSENSLARVRTRLSEHYPMEVPNQDNRFRILVFNSTVFVILSEGLLGNPNESEHETKSRLYEVRKSLAKLLMKACYTVAPIEIVTGHPSFKFYLKTLKQEAKHKLI